MECARTCVRNEEAIRLTSAEIRGCLGTSADLRELGTRVAQRRNNCADRPENWHEGG
jgi:hypothetical protein